MLQSRLYGFGGKFWMIETEDGNCEHDRVFSWSMVILQMKNVYEFDSKNDLHHIFNIFSSSFENFVLVHSYAQTLSFF